MDITMIGAGHVGSHLAEALFYAGHRIVQVYSRTEARARRLARIVDCAAITTLETLDAADLYLIAVHDDAIPDISQQLVDKIPGTAIVAHTAASIALSALSDHQRHGVFYPLQTFTQGRPVDLSDVPFLISGGNSGVVLDLCDLAGDLSNVVDVATDEQRAITHLAATISCNFTNHMYAIAAKLMEAGDLDYSLLTPLITETAFKGTEAPPRDAQTGPARRGDAVTMQKHLELLKALGMDDELYRVVSERIRRFEGLRGNWTRRSAEQYNQNASMAHNHIIPFRIARNTPLSTPTQSATLPSPFRYVSRNCSTLP